MQARLPSSLADVTAQAASSPALVLPLMKLLRMIDAAMPARFTFGTVQAAQSVHTRGRRAAVQATAARRKKQISAAKGDESSSSSEEEEEEEGGGAAGTGREVDFDRFAAVYYPHMSAALLRSLSPDAVWTEIVSQIKGSEWSVQAVLQGKKHVQREDYIELANT